jgi:hypothetical protein
MNGGAVPNQSCPSCGDENPQGAGFCVSCGAAVSESQPWTQPQYQQVGRPPYSRLGIVSFVLFLVSIALFLIALAATPFVMNNAGWELGILIQTSAALLMAALVLGIIGLFQKQRNRIFAVLGAVLSGGVIALVLVFANVVLPRVL